jgi:hypothetical protein
MRVEEFCVYILENYIDAGSICLHLFGMKVLHHHLEPKTCKNPIPISRRYFIVRILIFSFLHLHCNKYRLITTSK